MRWFHGTSKQNAEKILAEGVLKPGQDSLYDIDIPRPDAVYLADWDIAHQYALERNGVVIEVAQPNPKNLLPDEDDIYELLNDRGGELHTKGQAQAERVKALWLKKWNDENAAWRNEGHDEEKFPHYPDFETAWEAWGEIEYEGSAGLSDQMKELTDYIVENDPQLAKAIMEISGKAAHIGPIKVVGLAKRQTAAKKPDTVKTPGFVIEVPQERRKKFFVRPKSPFEYWAFKNRPRVFINEQIIFTFNGKPVAEAMVVKIEAPGHGEGEHKQWHKVYWKPSAFRKFRGVVAAAKGLPKFLYHGTPKSNLPKIMKDGLLPSSSKSSSMAIYLTNDLFTAQNYAGMYDEPFVVLKIDTSALDQNHFGPDDYELPDLWDNLPLKRRYSDPSEVSWQDSLRYVNQVTYDLKIPPTAISLAEKIASDDVAFEAHIEGQDQVADSVLQEYIRHYNDTSYRQQWRLVSAHRLKKIWNDYAKLGFVRDENGIDLIAGIVVENIHKMEINNVLSGHTPYDPEEWAEERLGYKLPEDYFNRNDSFMDDGKGQYRISDYAADKLTSAALRLRQAKSAEEKLQIIDHILNIVHQRGDIAAWFVEGGSSTLSSLAGTLDKAEETLENKLTPKGKSLLKKTTSEDPYLYHVTLQQNVDDILENGLKAEHGKEFFDDQPRSTFLTERRGLNFWKNEIADYYGDPVAVVKVPRQGLNLILDEQGTHDAGGTKAYRVEQDIPSHIIKLAMMVPWKSALLKKAVKPLHQALEELRPTFAQAAQGAYESGPEHEWQGICYHVAEAILEEALSVNPSWGGKVVDYGEHHSCAIICDRRACFRIDIPFGKYEKLIPREEKPGNKAYDYDMPWSFEMIPDVEFKSEDVEIEPAKRPWKKSAAVFPTFEQVTDKATDTNNEFDMDVWRDRNLGNMNEYYEEVAPKLKALKFPLTVYRCFALREGEKINYGELGGSWSLDSRSAYLTVHEMFDDSEYKSYPVVEGTIASPASVDWLNTVRAWMTLPEEREIRLKPGAKVKAKGKVRTAEIKFAAFYHGTNEDFKEFKSEGGVYYFTTSHQYADYWAGRATQRHGGDEDQKVIHEVGLDIKKPFDARKFKQKWLSMDEYAAALKAPEKNFYEKYESGVMVKTLGKKPFWKWFRLNEEESKKALQKRGYDGVIQIENSEFFEGGPSVSYVVFSPNQIKKTKYAAGFHNSVGWLTPDGKFHPLSIGESHAEGAVRIGISKDPLNMTEAFQAGAVRVVGTRWTDLEFESLNPKTLILIRDFILESRSSAEKIQFDWFKPARGHEEFYDMEEAMDWLENPRVTKDPRFVTSKAAELTEHPDYYMTEGCGIWAVDFAREHGGEIYVLSADRGEEWSEEIPYEVTHAFVKKDGKDYDIRGERTPDKMAWELSMADYSVKGPWTPDVFEAKFMGNGDDKPLFGKSAVTTLAIPKTADHVDEEGYWAGEGNAASGVLAVCPRKSTVCLAWRSSEVMTPNCWGTIGGAVQKDMSPQESAKHEMAEETGYRGGINLIPAFVFTDGGFSYYNFVGAVSSEFSFHPGEEHGWETDHIVWVPYEQVVKDMQENSEDYHPGLLKLFANSKDVIERALKIESSKTSAEKNPALIDFMKDLWAQTTGNPFNNRERVWKNKAIIEARPFDGRIHLSFIRSVEQGKGYGTEGLKLLTSLADKHGVSIDLDAEPPVGGKVLSQNQLVQWYKRHGFELVDAPNHLVYEPSKPLKLSPKTKMIPMDSASKQAYQEVAWSDKEGDLMGGILENDGVGTVVPDQIDTDPEIEWRKMYDWLNSLEWYGRNPWYPEKYPWFCIYLRPSRWIARNDVAEKQLAEGKDLASLKQYMSKYDLKKLRTPVYKTIDVTPTAPQTAIVRREASEKAAFTPPDASRRPCPSGKRKFYDEISAIGKHKSWDQNTPQLRAYKCPICGWWHLTSKAQKYTAAVTEQTHMFPSSQDAKFRAWFDGSKVVDKEGNPMPVYHGTRSSVEFEEFSVDGPPQVEDSYEGETTSSGSGADPTAFIGAHFAEETNVANQFAEGKGWTKTRYDGENEKPRVIQVFLRITNPKDFGSEHNLREFINQGKVSDDGALDIMCQAETGFESWQEEEEAAQATEGFFQKYDNDQAFRAEQHRNLFENHRSQEGEDTSLRDAAYELAMQARHRLEQAGHDGVRYKNVVEGGHAWIAFAASQIKSAWSATFDPRDPRFTASKDAGEHTPEYAQRLIKTLQQTVKDADFRVVGSVGTGAVSENDLDIMVDIHPDSAFEDDRAWVESSGLQGAMSILGFDYLGSSDFSSEESAEKSETSGKYLDPQGSGIEKFFNPTTMHTVEFWFTESGMPKEADWKSKYVLPTALALGLGGAPATAPSTFTPQQIEQQKEKQEEIAKQKQLDRLVEAIARAEGADPDLNNPGNIKDFNTGEIKEFDSFEDGRNALEDQLNRIADGDHPNIKPDMTLREAGLIYSNGDPNWARNISIIMHVPQSIKMEDLIRGRGTTRAQNMVTVPKSGAWLAKAAGFAFKSFKKLWHVGDMNPESKQIGSLEGAGLSVSVNPEEWQYIAKLGGDLWELTKPGNKFVNFHRISKQQKQAITDWGLINEYVEPRDLWRVEWWDEEDQEKKYSDFIDKYEADQEAESYPDSKVVPVGGLDPTEKLVGRTKQLHSDPMLAWDMLVTVYAEDELDCDGVWWADRLDQFALSAPRGVIFTGKLPSWKKRKVQQAVVAGKAKPSLTQVVALQGMASGNGTIRREQGGFWMWEPLKKKDNFGTPRFESEGVHWVDVRTVRAMEARGWVERTNMFPEEWRDTRMITDAGRVLLAGKTAADNSLESLLDLHDSIKEENRMVRHLSPHQFRAAMERLLDETGMLHKELERRAGNNPRIVEALKLGERYASQAATALHDESTPPESATSWLDSSIMQYHAALFALGRGTHELTEGIFSETASKPA